MNNFLSKLLTSVEMILLHMYLFRHKVVMTTTNIINRNAVPLFLLHFLFSYHHHFILCLLKSKFKKKSLLLCFLLKCVKESFLNFSYLLLASQFVQLYVKLILIFQNAWLYLTIGLLFILGSSLIIHMVFFAEEFAWVAKYTKDTLFVSAVRFTFLFHLNLFPIIKLFYFISF